MVPPARLFEINVVFCNDISFTHGHTVAIEATSEYAKMLREAIEPTMEHPDARHVRLVTLVIYDEFGGQLRSVDSGIFPCEDRPNG